MMRVLRGCARFGLVGAIGMIAVAALIYQTRGAWLPLLGRALNVSPEIHSADVIIVLGGGDGDRARYAGELYREGLSRHLIATGAPNGTDTSAENLAQWGVPRDAVVLANGTISTHDDAERTRQLMLAHGWKTALLVTDPYHIRRSLWTFQTSFEGTDLKVWPAPVADGWFDADHWWQNENGFVTVAEEYLKFAYYFARGYIGAQPIMAK